MRRDKKELGVDTVHKNLQYIKNQATLEGQKKPRRRNQVELLKVNRVYLGPLTLPLVSLIQLRAWDLPQSTTSQEVFLRKITSFEKNADLQLR